MRTQSQLVLNRQDDQTFDRATAILTALSPGAAARAYFVTGRPNATCRHLEAASQAVESEGQPARRPAVAALGAPAVFGSAAIEAQIESARLAYSSVADSRLFCVVDQLSELAAARSFSVEVAGVAAKPLLHLEHQRACSLVDMAVLAVSVIEQPVAPGWGGLLV